jgi:hypothetical protein
VGSPFEVGLVGALADSLLAVHRGCVVEVLAVVFAHAEGSGLQRRSMFLLVAL